MIARVWKEHKRNILIALANIVCITVIIYVLVLVFMPTDTIELERARVETRREVMDFTAYIFRNERVIYADFDIGRGLGAVYMVENGEKVARNQAIARINQGTYHGGGRAYTIGTEIEAIEDRIDILRRSNINLEHTPANIQNVNRNADDLYIETLRNVRNGSLRIAGSHRDEKLVLMNKRQVITGTAGNFGRMINSLTARKTELQSEFVGNTALADGGRNIYAERSGIFYRRADGFENYFTARAVRTLDLAAFDELTRRERDANIINRAIGKIAYDYRWYFVIRANRNEIVGMDFVEGRSRPYDIVCLYSSNRVIPFYLRSIISEHNSDDALLIFETTIIPPDFYFQRRQSVQVVLREISGIRVPNSAIVVRGVNRHWEFDENGEMREVVEIIENPEADPFAEEIIIGETVKGVYILHGREVRFRVLDDRDRLAEFDGYAIYAVPAQRVDGSTTTLLADEDIIVAGRNLYTGRIIG